MHTIHEADEAKNNIGYAGVGIFFDVNYSNAALTWAEEQVIDNFFDSLGWDNVDNTPVVNVL